jgi:hypothetical protein
MERDKGIEPSPPPWQGGVLPLYESRNRSQSNCCLFIARAKEAKQAATQRCSDLETLPRCFRILGWHDPCAGAECFNLLPKCERFVRPEISFAVQRNVPHARGQCKRAQIFHHRDNKLSPASDDVYGDGRGAGASVPEQRFLGPSSFVFSKAPGSLKHGTQLKRFNYCNSFAPAQVT